MWHTDIAWADTATFAPSVRLSCVNDYKYWTQRHEQDLIENRHVLDAFISSYQLAKAWPIRVASMSASSVTVMLHPIKLWTMMGRIQQSAFSSPSKHCMRCDPTTILDCALYGSIDLTVMLRAVDHDNIDNVPMTSSYSITMNDSSNADLILYAETGLLGTYDAALDGWYDHTMNSVEFVVIHGREYAVSLYATNLTHSTLSCNPTGTSSLWWPAWPYAYANTATCSSVYNAASRPLTPLDYSTSFQSIPLPMNMITPQQPFHDWYDQLLSEMTTIYSDAFHKTANDPCPFIQTIRSQHRYVGFYIERTQLIHYTDLIYNSHRPLPDYERARFYRPASEYSISEQYDFALNYTKQSERRRLLPFERAIDRRQADHLCTSQFYHWYSAYAIWHDEMSTKLHQSTDALQTSVKLNLTYFVTSPHRTGLADRLNGFIGTSVITTLLSQRYLVKLDEDWLQYDQIMSTSIDLSTKRSATFLDWNVPSIHYPWYYVYHGTGSIPTSFVKLWSVWSVVAIKTWAAMTYRILHSHDPPYDDFFANMGMTVETLYPCLYHATHQPRLQMLMDTHIESRFIFHSQIYAHLLQPTATTTIIGVQVRSSDDVFDPAYLQARLWKTDSSILENAVPHFQCAHQVTDVLCAAPSDAASKADHSSTRISGRKSREVFWLLNTDDYTVKLAAVRRYGVSVLKSIADAQWKSAQSQLLSRSAVPHRPLSSSPTISATPQLLSEQELRHREFAEECLVNDFRNVSHFVQCPLVPKLLTVLAPATHIAVELQDQAWLSHTRDGMSSSITSHRQALMDLFYFSLCDEHVITFESGFGRIPALLALNKKSLYTISNRQRYLTDHAVVDCQIDSDYNTQLMTNMTLVNNWIRKQLESGVEEPVLTGVAIPLSLAAQQVSQI